MAKNPEQRRRADIAPTITAFTPEQYKQQLDKIKFAKRIHPDFTDGVFAPSRTINLAQAYWPDDMQVDLHVMYRQPDEHLETLISLKPDLVILHAEAKGDLKSLFEQLTQVGIKTGVAILPETSVKSVAELVRLADHVLIFGGRLGYQGSEPQKENLVKLKQVKQINPNIETGWDGGVNSENAEEILAAGADVLNVGGYIQKAEDPKKAYNKLVEIAQKVG